MTDFFSDSPTATNALEFTVSELSGALKRTVEDAFGYVRVRGEISGYRGAHASGHAYFALKDDKARLEAVIWRGVMSKLKFLPEEGMEVIVTGKLTTYPGSSKYQIVIDNLEPAGAGALMALLEARKQKLAGEGLFDVANKQLLPFLPRVIGVVTSPTGAVIRDIIHRISDRFPLHIIVWPVRVQGENCGEEVTAAIKGFNAIGDNDVMPKPDVIIVARGGGSLEDLWGFNDEGVVRAVAESFIPIISAVGHETDWTLIDYAADVRAPTPTGAAEISVPVKADLQAEVAALHARLHGGASRQFDFRQQKLRSITRALPSIDQLLALPRRRFDEASSRLERTLTVSNDKKRQLFNTLAKSLSPYLIVNYIERYTQKTRHLALRFEQAFATVTDKRRHYFDALQKNLSPRLVENPINKNKEAGKFFQSRLENAFSQLVGKNLQRLNSAERLLRSVSYTRVLERGFALVLDSHKNPVKKAAQLPADGHIEIKFADAVVTATTSNQELKRQKREKTSTPDLGKQGDLF